MGIFGFWGSLGFWYFGCGMFGRCYFGWACLWGFAFWVVLCLPVLLCNFEDLVFRFVLGWRLIGVWFLWVCAVVWCSFWDGVYCVVSLGGLCFVGLS